LKVLDSVVGADANPLVKLLLKFKNNSLQQIIAFRIGSTFLLCFKSQRRFSNKDYLIIK